MSILGNSDIIKFMDDSTSQDENSMDSDCEGNDLSLWRVTKTEDVVHLVSFCHR